MSLLRRPKALVSSIGTWGSGSYLGADRDGYSADEALEISTVIACLRLRADTLAQIPFKSYRDDGGLSVELVRQPDILTRPSVTVTPSTWKRQMSISRDLWGYAAGWTTARDAAGYPKQVEWLPPSELQHDPFTPGKPAVWRWNGAPIRTEDLVIIPSSIVLPGSPIGVAPLEHTGLVDLADRAREFGADWFRNGAPPSYVVKSETKLTPAQADDLSDAIAARWRRRKPAVISAGLDIQANEIKPDESQFLETLRHVQVDICHAFGVPPEKFGLSASTGGSLTYANREQNQQQWMIDSVNGDLVLLQEVFTDLLPRPQYVRANSAALLRSDLVTRANAYQTLISAGVLDPDEARAFEDWGPRPTPTMPTTGGQ